MAYVTKYRITFSDLHAVNPADWQIDFQMDSYDGDIIALQPGANPLTINFGADSDSTDDKLAALIGTEADITITITDAAFDKTEFWVTEETTIRTMIYRNSMLYFSGFVKPDFCAYPYKQPPYEFTISASDGIGFLKGIAVDLADESRNGELIGIIDLLTTRGLYKAQNNEIQALFLLSSLHRDGLVPFHNEKISPELFYQDLETHTFFDIFTVLEYIASSYGLRILTAEGNYWAQRMPDMPKNVLPILHRFNTPDFTPITVDDYEVIKELGGPDDLSTSDLIYANNDSYVTIQPALKTIKADLDYTFNAGLLNFDWFDYNSGQFDNWIPRDANCIVHQIPNSDNPAQYSCYIEGYDGGTTWIDQSRNTLYGWASITVKTKMRFYGYDIVKLNFRINTRDSSDPLGTYVAYQQGTGTWVLNDGSDVSDGDYTITKDANSDVVDVNVTLPFWDAPTILGVGGVSAPWFFEIRVIDPGQGNSDTNRPAGITAAGVEVWPITVDFRYSDIIGDLVTVDNPLNYSTVKSLDNFKLIETKTGIHNVANGLRYPEETELLSWKSDDQNYSSTTFHITQFRSILNLMDYPYENMTGTYYSNSISPNHVIKRLADGKYFIVMSDEYDVKTCQHKMKLFEIKDVTVVSPTLEVKENFKKGEAFKQI